MGLVAAVGAEEQPAAVVEPGEGAFDDPAVSAEAGAVYGLAPGDHRLDAALPEQPPVLVVVVAAVGDDAVGSPPWPSDATADRRYPIEQRQQLRDVVAVTAGQRPGQRQPAAIYEEMLFAPAAAPVDRAGTRLRTPFFACTWLESAIARDHSISPAACNSASNSSCSRCQTPAASHARSRRQQVIPQPKPSSCGKCSQPTPVCSTNKIPCNASRSSNGFRPG